MRVVPLGRPAVVLSLLLASALGAAPAEPKADGPSAVEKVRKALNQPVTVKIDKQPLSAAVDMLREKTKLNLVLDGPTIQQQLGFTPDMPNVAVDVDLKDVPVRTALREVLDPYGLTYVVIGDAVILTTDEMAMSRQLRQRVSVDMDKVDVADALQKVARDAGVNVLLDSRVMKDAGDKVTLRLEDVPVETAVRLLAEMAGLKPVRVGNVLFVTSKENAAEMRNDPELSQSIGSQPVPKQ
jgi:hypothetical protein